MRIPDLAAALACLVLALPAAAQTHDTIGRPATAGEIAGWNIDVAPDGKNLPPGSATVAQGGEVFATQCAACHGAKGEGGMGDRLAGGMGSLASAKPIKTVGSYWPYATTLFDYIRRAMPQNAPQSLSNNDVYAVSGYVLFLNGLLAETATVDASTLLAVKMPNREGFVSDPRPDVHEAACMKDCR
ncbi:MAG: cytochrome c [Acetobacteraceae bacterium]